MPSIGLWELVLIFLIVLVLFGPKALPKIGSALGKGIRDFKDATRGLSTDLEDDDRRRPEPVQRQSIPAEKPAVISPLPTEKQENSTVEQVYQPPVDRS